jgi:hypothetical protein
VLSARELDGLADRCRERLGTETFERLHEHGRAAADKEIMDLVRVAIGRVLARRVP